MIFLLTCTVLLCETYGAKSADIRNEKERVNSMFTSSACGLALIIAIVCRAILGYISNVGASIILLLLQFSCETQVHVWSVMCCADFYRDLCCKF